jgi:putative alpha-1,2-mannosidase
VNPEGLPGNDDLGSMSAWYVWSALGLYPFMAGAPYYVIGSPAFERATIHWNDLGGDLRTLVLEANGATSTKTYIQSVACDDRALDRAFVEHDAIRGGARIAFTMGAEPSAWASALGATPPSACPDAQ